MSLYVIADLHLSKSTEKPMDIFGSRWDGYMEKIEKCWRERVTDEDTVVVAGDISWAMTTAELKPDFDFIESLPGKKILSKGNHDYWWQTMAKLDAFVAENGYKTISFLHNNAYRVGDFAICGSRGWFFDCTEKNDKKVILREAQRLRTSIDEAKKLGGEVIVFLHYPPLMTTGVCEEIIDVIKSNGVRRCYYAHLHGASCQSAVTGDVDGVRYSLISADHLEFCPKLVEKIR